MFDVGDEHAVTLAGLTGLGVEVELRHEEQRQTLGARSGALGAGQHQVQDVLAEVVGITGGDEALNTVDVPGAVGLRDGLGAAGADIRAGVRLGEHHGRGPTALRGQHRPLLLLLGAEVVQDLRHARAHRVHVRGGVGAEDVLDQRPLECAGHRHTAELLGEADLVPTAVEEGTHRLLERLGKRDRMGLGVEHRRIAVGIGKGLSDRSLRQPGHFAEHFGCGVGVQFGVVALTERLIHTEYLEQVEYLVTNVALVVAHVSSSSRMPLAVGYFCLSYPPVTVPNYTVQ